MRSNASPTFVWFEIAVAAYNQVHRSPALRPKEVNSMTLDAGERIDQTRVGQEQEDGHCQC